MQNEILKEKFIEEMKQAGFYVFPQYPIYYFIKIKDALSSFRVEVNGERLYITIIKMDNGIKYKDIYSGNIIPPCVIEAIIEANMELECQIV